VPRVLSSDPSHGIPNPHLGGTGVQLVKQGLSMGHSISVLVRSNEKLAGLLSKEEFDKIRVVQGDALDELRVDETIQGVCN
jgi:hypothetical protein